VRNPQPPGLAVPRKTATLRLSGGCTPAAGAADRFGGRDEVHALRAVEDLPWKFANKPPARAACRAVLKRCDIAFHERGGAFRATALVREGPPRRPPDLSRCKYQPFVLVAYCLWCPTDAVLWLCL
jgi:hypothetical protein